MSKDTPAFPNSVQPDFQFAEPGMSLRQWYAGMALASMIGDAAPVASTREGSLSLLAEQCFAIADAMLAHEESE